jgi:hypothetical protein
MSVAPRASLRARVTVSPSQLCATVLWTQRVSIYSRENRSLQRNQPRDRRPPPRFSCVCGRCDFGPYMAAPLPLRLRG